jgi:hypothetical protein
LEREKTMNETKEQAIELSDLETPSAGEVKGGPRLIIKKAPTFHDELGVDLPDLAPQAEVKGGVSHTAGRCSCGQEHPYGGGGFINNHNETVVSDEDLKSLTDLEPREEVVGGVKSGFAYAALTVGGATNLNQVTERTGNLTYSGESGGI